MPSTTKPAFCVTPKAPADDLISGSADNGTLKSFKRSLSQPNVFKFINIVRDALLTSVAKVFPEVSFHIINVSILPKAKSLSFKAFLTAGTFSINQRILLAEK